MNTSSVQLFKFIVILSWETNKANNLIKHKVSEIAFFHLLRMVLFLNWGISRLQDPYKNPPAGGYWCLKSELGAYLNGQFFYYYTI